MWKVAVALMLGLVAVTAGRGTALSSLQPAGEEIVGEAELEAMSQWEEPNRIVAPGDPAPSGGAFQAVLSHRLNNRGDMAFVASVRTDAGPVLGMFRWSDGQLIVLASGQDFDLSGAVAGFDFNDSGEVVFQAGQSAIYRVADGQTQRVAGAGDAFTGGGVFELVANPTVNENGQIAFSGRDDLAPIHTGVFLWTAGGGIETVMLTEGSCGANGHVADDGGVYVVGNMWGGVCGEPATLRHWSAGQLVRVFGEGDILPSGSTIGDWGGALSPSLASQQAVVRLPETQDGVFFRPVIHRFGPSGLGDRVAGAGDEYCRVECVAPSVNAAGAVSFYETPGTFGCSSIWVAASGEYTRVVPCVERGGQQINDRGDLAWVSGGELWLARGAMEEIGPSCEGLSLTVERDTSASVGAPCSPSPGEAAAAGYTHYALTLGGLAQTVGSVATGGVWSDQITYTPPTGYVGEDSFLVGLSVCRGSDCSASELARVSVLVETQRERVVIVLPGIDSEASCSATPGGIDALSTEITQAVLVQRPTTEPDVAVRVMQLSYGPESRCPGDPTQVSYTRRDSCTVGVREAAAKLDRLLATIPERSTVDLVGFSMGGVVASYWLATMADQEGLRSRIHSVITLDSPLTRRPISVLFEHFRGISCQRQDRSVQDLTGARDGLLPSVYSLITAERTTARELMSGVICTAIGDLVPGHWRNFRRDDVTLAHDCGWTQANVLRQLGESVWADFVDDTLSDGTWASGPMLTFSGSWAHVSDIYIRATNGTQHVAMDGSAALSVEIESGSSLVLRYTGAGAQLTGARPRTFGTIVSVQVDGRDIGTLHSLCVGRCERTLDVAPGRHIVVLSVVSPGLVGFAFDGVDVSR